jgi:hypothetical protein
MSAEPPDGHDLIFPTVVNVPSVAMLIASGAASSAPDPKDTSTTKSSSPIVGFGRLLTDGFVDAGFGGIRAPLALLVRLFLRQALRSGGHARNKLLSPAAQPAHSLNHTLLWNPNSSNGFSS